MAEHKAALSGRDGSQSSHIQLTQFQESDWAYSPAGQICSSRVPCKLPVCLSIDDSGLPFGHLVFSHGTGSFLLNSISLWLMIEVQAVSTELTHTHLRFLRMYTESIRNQYWALLPSMITRCHGPSAHQ